MRQSFDNQAPFGNAARCPSDFRYREALDQPWVRRVRRICQTFLGFDAVPTDAQMVQMVQDMYAGDPVAEAFVQDAFLGPSGPRAGRRLLDAALEHGIDAVGDVSESMRRLFAEFEHAPDWVQPELVEQGARIWRRWGTTLFKIAGAETIATCTENAIAVPLFVAGGYTGASTRRRFLATVRFWIDVSEPGALFRPGSAGRAACMRVRVMHVGVRRRVASSKEWDGERFGLPLSQAHMMLPLMGGSIGPALTMWPLGYQTSPSEIRALLHFQRFFGHLVGSQPRFYPNSVHEAMQLLFALAIASSYASGKYGVKLIESFPQAFAPQARPFSMRYFQELPAYWMMRAYSDALISAWTGAHSALPRALPWAALLLARAPWVATTEIARRLVPGVEGWLERAGSQQREHWYALKMRDRKEVLVGGAHVENVAAESAAVDPGSQSTLCANIE